MLRAVGRIHILSHPSLVLCLHSSCALPASHALALPQQSTSVTHSPHTAPPACPPSLRPPRPCGTPDHRGQFPSDVIDIIDAFASRTTPDINPSFPFRRYLRQRESARRLAQFLASTSRPSRAQAAMSLAHTLGCRFKPNHFESVVYQLALNEHWSLIPSLVSLASQQCGKTTARLLNWKIRALVECHRFACLDHVLAEFARDSVPPTRRTFHLLVSGHLRNQDLDSAKAVLQSMEIAGFPIDASTHALIVTAYRSLGLDPQVHTRALDASSLVDARTSTRVINSVIQHHLDVGDESSAAEHVNRMSRGETGGTITNVDGDDHSFIDTFATPPSGRSSVFLPDAATFTILINYLNRQRQFHRVPKVLSRMIEIGVDPDAGLVASLIRTYSLSGRDDMAMSLLAAMLGFDADARDLLALLRLEGISQFPVNIKGIRLSVHVFNAALPRIMEIRGLTGAIFVFRIMRSKGIQSNAVTIQIFLDHLDRVQHMDTRRLTQVLRSMLRNHRGPTIQHLNMILRNALRREEYRTYGCGWDATAAKFSSTRRVTPRIPENRTLLDSAHFDPGGSDRSPLSDSCLRSITLALSRNGVKNDRATFALWLKREGIADPTLGTAKSVYRHMVDKGMHPNRFHFASLMVGFTRAGDMQAAEQVMRSANATGFEPDAAMWTILITGYGRKGAPELAMRTFREMVAAGISPDVAAIDALAHAYFAVGAFSVARRVLLELWPWVKPFPSELKNAPLKQLARTFRQPDCPRSIRSEALTSEEQHSFNRKLRQVLQEWKLFAL